MNDLKNLWLYFDGKKTNIGAVLLFLSTLITQWLIGVNHFDPSWLDTVVLNLNYIGGVLTVGGLTHQAVKISKGEDTGTKS